MSWGNAWGQVGGSVAGFGSYSALKTAVANWLDRTDLTARIPEFISLAEVEFNRRIRTVDMVERDDAFEVANRYEPLPEDYLGAVQFTLQRTPVVHLASQTAPRLSMERSRYASSGIPIYYTVVGSNFEFLPTPNGTYTATLLYYKRIQSLSNENTTNWLLEAHPDLYLYGALKAAEPYIRDEERLGVWAAQHEAAIAQLERQDARANRGMPITRGRSF